MKKVLTSKIKIICFLAATFLISCASTPKAENNSSVTEAASKENTEEENSVSASQDKAENETASKRTDKVLTEPEAAATENTTSETDASKNPLETIIEQNVPEDNFPKSNAPNEPDATSLKVPAAPESSTSDEDFPSSAEKQNQIDENPNQNLGDSRNQETENLPFSQTENKNEEKVDDAELNPGKTDETAPETQNAPKLTEPDIFEEPEVIEAQNENETKIADETAPQMTQEPEPANPKEAETLPAEKEKKADEDAADKENMAEKTENQVNFQNATEKSDSEAEASNPNTENKAEENQESENTNQIIPSRSVTIKRNQYLDVVYPGSGWVYLGTAERNEDSLLRYFGRRIAKENSTFTFRSLKAGSSILHFYKNDALTGNFIDDYLEVTVQDEIYRGNVRAHAPDYAEIVPPRFEKRHKEAQIQTENQQESYQEDDSGEKNSKNLNIQENSQNQKSGDSEFTKPEEQTKSENGISNSAFSDNVKTVISNSDSQADSSRSQNSQFYTQNPAQETESSETEIAQAEPEVQVSSEENEKNLKIDDSVLEKAQQLFKDKKYEESLETVQGYINGASTHLDEAYYLLGQLYESDSSVKNVKNAVDAYDMVTKNYPLSKLWRNARDRSIYLKRFYIDIR